MEEAALARGRRNSAKPFKIYQRWATSEQRQSSLQSYLCLPHVNLHRRTSHANYLFLLGKPPAFLVFCLLQLPKAQLPARTDVDVMLPLALHGWCFSWVSVRPRVKSQLSLLAGLWLVPTKPLADQPVKWGRSSPLLLGFVCFAYRECKLSGDRNLHCTARWAISTATSWIPEDLGRNIFSFRTWKRFHSLTCNTQGSCPELELTQKPARASYKKRGIPPGESPLGLFVKQFYL